jgi:hypothetical protein
MVVQDKIVNPQAVVASGQKMASLLQGVIAGKKKPVMINGEQYLEFEDWQLLARFNQLSVKVDWTKPVLEKDVILGYEARAVVLARDGREVSSAESMCLRNEKQWVNKDLFQVRSMAQTRACAKALRNVLSWVVVMAGYKSSVSEEM